MLLAVQAAPSLWGHKTLPLSSLFTSEVELTAVIAAGLLRIWGIWLNFVVENECVAEFSQLIRTHSLTHASALFFTSEMDLFHFKLFWAVQSEKKPQKFSSKTVPAKILYCRIQQEVIEVCNCYSTLFLEAPNLGSRSRNIFHLSSI